MLQFYRYLEVAEKFGVGDLSSWERSEAFRQKVSTRVRLDELPGAVQAYQRRRGVGRTVVLPQAPPPEAVSGGSDGA